MGDMQGPKVEFLQDALKRARQAAQERPLASQLSQCRSFIERSERRLEKIDGERAAETVQLNKARSRLTRLEAQAAVLLSDVPRHTLAADVSVELEELRRSWLPQNGNETRHCLHQLASGKRCHALFSLAPHFRFPIRSCLQICPRGWTIVMRSFSRPSRLGTP